MSSTELLDLMDQMIADTLATGRTEYIYADQSVAKSLQVRLQKRCKRLQSASGAMRPRWLTPLQPARAVIDWWAFWGFPGAFPSPRS